MNDDLCGVETDAELAATTQRRLQCAIIHGGSLRAYILDRATQAFAFSLRDLDGTSVRQQWTAVRRGAAVEFDAIPAIPFCRRDLEREIIQHALGMAPQRFDGSGLCPTLDAERQVRDARTGGLARVTRSDELDFDATRCHFLPCRQLDAIRQFGRCELSSTFARRRRQQRRAKRHQDATTGSMPPPGANHGATIHHVARE